MTARYRRESTIERARWHLWAVTFVIMTALVGAVVYVSSNEGENQIATLLPTGRLRIALGVLVVGFLTYVIDRERNLRRLQDRLTEEHVESTRLMTRLEYLTELHRERDTNAALLDGSADGVAVVDADLRLLRFNAAMHVLTGVDAVRAVGAYAPAILRFTSPDGVVLTEDAYPLRAALDEGIPITGIELRMQVSGGGERWVSGTFSPIHDADGERPALLLAVLRDITEAKEMQTLQRDFVSIVSHELRAPLTAIKGFAKTLLQRGEALPPETRANFLTTVNAQADRLARLVDDLLQVSRIDARRLRMDIQPVAPADLVRDVLDHFSGKWDRPVDVEIPRNLPAVAADRPKLEEVLINLIDNAIKYSPPEARVRIVARESDGEVEVAVEDRGCGISAEDTAKLFQKFQRLSTPATRDVGGTGLGLYIVKGLVDAMGGRVWVESAPGDGSTFAFTIPLARVDATEHIEKVGA
ncbi:MAG TPA: ATP-binding protein [Actinomycetota bacterium]